MREPRNRVVQVRRFGGPDELEVVDAPLPTAGRGEVRVRVLASAAIQSQSLPFLLPPLSATAIPRISPRSPSLVNASLDGGVTSWVHHTTPSTSGYGSVPIRSHWDKESVLHQSSRCHENTTKQPTARSQKSCGRDP